MNCLHCNKPIEGRRNTKKYCNNTCKQYAYLSRNNFLHKNQNLNGETETNLNPQSLQLNQDKNSDPSIPIIKNVVSSHQTNFVIKKHEEKKESEEKIYKNIWPDIFVRIQNAQMALDISSNYFTNGYRGRVTEENRSAFIYVITRLRCIIENLFSLSYKKKVYYKTINCVKLALLETILSEQMRKLPKDFPFIDDMLKLEKQFETLEEVLKKDKEGIKLSLNKANIVRFIIILDLIRQFSKRKSFQELFPKIYVNQEISIPKADT